MMTLQSLFDKPTSQQFTKEEIEFLKKNLPRRKWRAKYAIYKPKSKLGKQIAFIIDHVPFAPRKSGMDNLYEWIEERLLTDSEYDWVIGNWGTNTRRFTIWEFRSIEELIQDHQAYNPVIKVPDKFIEICKERRLSMSYQTKINFES